MNEESIITILSNYELGDLISKQDYSTGTVQKNIQLKTDTGVYVLKYYITRPEEYVKFELSLIEHLNKNNFCCPLIYQTKNGERYKIFNNKVVAIYEYIEGVHKNVLKYEHVDQVIQKIAELHLITNNLHIKGYNHRWNYGKEFCVEFIKGNLKNKESTTAIQKKKWLMKELNNLILPENISKGIVHGDLDTSNIIFRNQKIKALIDFDDSNYSYLLLDLIGIIDIKKYKFLSNKYFELIRYVFNKYELIRKLNANDKMHLFDVLKLSILIDSLWYFDRGNFSEFYERNKIEELNVLGRERFNKKIYDA